MKEAMDGVRAFHEAFNIPIKKDGPGLSSPEPNADGPRAFRINLLEEEWNEYLDAENEDDLVEVADALADMVYIICGTALTYGIPLARVFAEVQRSNMAKLGPDGPVYRESDGKVMKPPGWTPPNIMGVLAAEDYVVEFRSKEDNLNCRDDVYDKVSIYGSADDPSS